MQDHSSIKVRFEQSQFNLCRALGKSPTTEVVWDVPILCKQDKQTNINDDSHGNLLKYC